jgi:hypothetical protein
MQMPFFFRLLDPFLIWFYRITGYALVDFFIGTFVLALIAVIIGEFSISAIFLATRKHIDQSTQDAIKYQNMSVDALAHANKPAYSAANKLANDAFGLSFFQQIALSAAFLWPIPFALAWMQYRFLGVDFPVPFTGYSVSFVAVFVLVYLVAYFLFKRVKYRLPFFRRMKVIMDTYKTQTQEMKTLADLLPPAAKPKAK